MLGGDSCHTLLRFRVAFCGLQFGVIASLKLKGHPALLGPTNSDTCQTISLPTGLPERGKLLWREERPAFGKDDRNWPASPRNSFRVSRGEALSTWLLFLSLPVTAKPQCYFHRCPFREIDGPETTRYTRAIYFSTKTTKKDTYGYFAWPWVKIPYHLPQNGIPFVLTRSHLEDPKTLQRIHVGHPQKRSFPRASGRPAAKATWGLLPPAWHTPHRRPSFAGPEIAHRLRPSDQLQGAIDSVRPVRGE